MKTRIFEELATYYQLWRDTCLGKNHSQAGEVDFVHTIFESMSIHSVIDLGGGIGIHSIPLRQKGYETTLLDQSVNALLIASRLDPALKIVEGKFEAIQCDDRFDAAMCMWSSLSYVLNTKQRQNFYSWINLHISKLIILDQPNFSRYPHNSHKIYEGENATHRMQVTRDWHITDKCKHTQFTYHIHDKQNGNQAVINDQEEQHYLTIDEIQVLLGLKWRLSTVYGDYSTKSFFDPESSSRMITVFLRCEE